MQQIIDKKQLKLEICEEKNGKYCEMFNDMKNCEIKINKFKACVIKKFKQLNVKYLSKVNNKRIKIITCKRERKNKL